jgi:hypothetical protein
MAIQTLSIAEARATIDEPTQKASKHRKFWTDELLPFIAGLDSSESVVIDLLDTTTDDGTLLGTKAASLLSSYNGKVKEYNADELHTVKLRLIVRKRNAADTKLTADEDGKVAILVYN